MDICKRIKELINNKAWCKNDIGIGRIQLIKIMLINENLVLIIKGDNEKPPIWAEILKIIEINNELMIFFDGKYDLFLEKEEYEEYKEFLSREEWNLLFKEDGKSKILENYKVDEKGFYLEIHDNLRNFEGKYEDIDLNEIKEKMLNDCF